MTARHFLMIAALSGLLAVALGAFASHGLKGMLEPYLLQVFQTGVQYQFYHTLALLAVALLPQGPAIRLAGWGFISGIVLFSGSLYVLALSGVHWLGAITPLGGCAFLTGWGALFWAAFKSDRNQIDADSTQR